MKTVILSLVIAFFLGIPNAYAQEVETFFIASDYWPPFRIKGEYGEIVGADREIMERIAERMGIRFVWTIRPWARCLYEMEIGLSDIMTGLAKRPEREKYIQYSEIPYYRCAPEFYVHKGQLQNDIRQYEDLKGLTIGYVRDSAYFERFDNDSTLSKFIGSTEDQLIKMLVEKRLDVIVGTDCQVEYDIKQRGLTGKIVSTAYKPEKWTDLFMGISKNSSFLKHQEEFNKTLKEMVDDGTVDRIFKGLTGH